MKVLSIGCTKRIYLFLINCRNYFSHFIALLKEKWTIPVEDGKRIVVTKYQLLIFPNEREGYITKYPKKIHADLPQITTI
jgi:hypothetical protein